MKKTLLTLGLGIFLASGLYAKEAKGLNVVVTSGDAQTQMMSMVLSMQTLKQKKDVNMVLCSKAGDLAVKGVESPILKPLDKSPKMMLKAIIKAGADVKVCPLYLPNEGKDKSVLIDGVKVAKPGKVAKSLLDKDYQNLSY